MTTQKRNSIIIIIGLIVVLVAAINTPYFWDTTNQPHEVRTKYVDEASTDYYFVTDWGSHFLVDKERVQEINAELRMCLINRTSCEKCYGQEWSTADDIRSHVLDCDNEAWNKELIRQEPPTFYSYPKGEEDPYEEFELCVHAFGGAWDFTDDTSAEDVRQSVLECLKLFPKENV